MLLRRNSCIHQLCHENGSQFGVFWAHKQWAFKDNVQKELTRLTVMWYEFWWEGTIFIVIHAEYWNFLTHMPQLRWLDAFFILTHLATFEQMYANFNDNESKCVGVDNWRFMLFYFLNFHQYFGWNSQINVLRKDSQTKCLLRGGLFQLKLRVQILLKCWFFQHVSYSEWRKNKSCFKSCHF